MSKSVMRAGLLTIGFAALAFAAGPAFEDLDRNGDGKISKDEAAVVEGLDFSAADANGDGWLDRSEYSKGIQGTRGAEPRDGMHPGGVPGVPQ